MNILPISISQPKRHNPAFGVNDYVSKKVLEASAKEASEKLAQKAAEKAPEVAAVAAAVVASLPTLNSKLKENGITFFNIDKDVIQVASGYNGGYYKIRTKNLPTDIAAKDYILTAVTNRHDSAGGLYNYMNFVRDIKRQDIIQKGLKIFTYELNNSINLDDRFLAAENLSKAAGHAVLQNQLFYVKNDAYYYDQDNKTAYAIDLATQGGYTKPIIKVCKFFIDDNKNAVGYKIKDWNAYNWGYAEQEYMEQQEPSTELPRVANTDNNKLFAEAFRFGNSKVKDNFRTKVGIPVVLNTLSRKLGTKNLDENSLQIVRYYDKNKEVHSLICIHLASERYRQLRCKSRGL